jgi:PleD family two-component response regulator
MPKTIIAIVDDLFFAAKIRGIAEQCDAQTSFARTIEGAVAAAENAKPDLVIVDLHSQRIDPMALAQALKAHADLRMVPLMGFFSHVQVELQRQAKEAGFDLTVPRSALTESLGRMLGQSSER